MKITGIFITILLLIVFTFTLYPENLENLLGNTGDEESIGESPKDKAQKSLTTLRRIHLVIAPVTFGAFVYNSVFGYVMMGTLYKGSALPAFYRPFKIVHIAFSAYTPYT